MPEAPSQRLAHGPASHGQPNRPPLPPTSHLAVFLFSAERAWAHAQERKAALGPDPDADARRGVLSRLTKAVAWGRKLVAAAAGVGATPRTVVEAAAYSAS